MLDFFKRDDLISMKHLNELMHNLNKKHAIEEKKVNTWLIVGLVALGIAVAGLIVYKLFFAPKDDDYDDYDDDFEEMDYDDDYDDLEDLEEDESEDLEDLDGFEETSEKFEE